MVFLLLQLVLLSRQGLIAWFVGGLDVRYPSAELAAAATESGIAPTIVREVEATSRVCWRMVRPRYPTLWIPTRWVDELASASCRLRSRVVQASGPGLRRRGVLVAVAWNTLGFALASAAPRADLVTAAGLSPRLRGSHSGPLSACWSFRACHDPQSSPPIDGRVDVRRERRCVNDHAARRLAGR